MDVKHQRALLAASIAGILAAVGFVSVGHAADKVAGAKDTGHCYGVNKCKGAGDCGGKGHSCAGQNACKGQGFIDLSQKDCLRIEGGRLTAEPEPS